MTYMGGTTRSEWVTKAPCERPMVKTFDSDYDVESLRTTCSMYRPYYISYILGDRDIITMTRSMERATGKTQTQDAMRF